MAGRNPWECHKELQEALSHHAIPYSTGTWWVQTFTSGRVSTANMPCSGYSVSTAITEQCMHEDIEYAYILLRMS